MCFQNGCKSQNQSQYVSSDLVKQYELFAPWTVPVGAEFVHGVGSAVNEAIERNLIGCQNVNQNGEISDVSPFSTSLDVFHRSIFLAM